MDPEITINVNLPPDASQAATMAGRTEAAGGPPPMALDHLQANASAAAPSPAEPGALQAQGSITAAAGAAPPPMDIGRLQATMGSDAPSPVSFGMLADASTAPAPTLQALGAAGADGAPQPMPIEDLEEPTGKSSSRRK